MKTFELKVAISNRADMNELVDTVCHMLGKDATHVKDKFKMVSQADLKKVLDMCKFLKVKAIFDPTGKSNTLTIEIPSRSVVKGGRPSVTEETKEDPTEETIEPADTFTSVNDEEEGSDDPF